MSSRIDVLQARQMTEKGRLEKLASKKAKSEVRERLAEIETENELRWISQRDWLMGLAIEGHKNAKSPSPICRPKRLLDLGFKIREDGVVAPSRNMVMEDKASQLYTLEKDIEENVDDFIDAALKDLEDYYGDLHELHFQMHSALQESIKNHKKFPGDYYFDRIVPADIRNKYKKNIEAINDKLCNYSSCKEDFEMIEACDEQEFIFRFSTDTHFFTSRDERVSTDELHACHENNELYILWDGYEDIRSPPELFFSGAGLFWLASSYGQRLVDDIFSRIAVTSSKGLNKLKIIFWTQNTKWFMDGRNNTKIESPNPVELTPYLINKGFSVDHVLKDDEVIDLNISW